MNTTSESMSVEELSDQVWLDHIIASAVETEGDYDGFILGRAEYAGLIALARRAVEGWPNWQKIETAPNDGTQKFLALFPGGQIHHVYLTAPEPPLVQTYRYAGGPARGQQAGWPTHWTRLPPPPSMAEHDPPPDAPASGGFEPGWLARDIERAHKQAERWRKGESEPLPSASADVAELVERLRATREVFWGGANTPTTSPPPIMLEAAALLESLESDRSYFKDKFCRFADDNEKLCADNASLRETVERYRSGLEKIAKWAKEIDDEATYDDIEKLARSLLQGT